MEWATLTRLSPHCDETAEGYRIYRDVPIARTGTQIYWENEVPPLQGDVGGRVHVSRDETEVFNPESIRSFEGKPLVDDHPFDAVGPDNWDNLAIGYVVNPRRGKGVHDDLLLADLVFTTRRGIDAVKRGKRAISVGYNAFYEQTAPGLGRQKSIFCNHVALVDEGRCGARCSIMDGRTVYDYDGVDEPNWERATFQADEFVESEHPRGQPENAGEFVKGSGSAKGGEAEGGSNGAAKTPSHGVTGLPDAKLPRELRGLADRGGYEMSAEKQEKGKFESGNRYEVIVKAKPTPGIKSVGEGRRTVQYDPELAQPETLNPEEPIIAREIAVLKKGLPGRIPIERDPDQMYRGMSAEEFENFTKTGQIKSASEYNMQGQESLTYWSQNPSEAESYANSFAPAAFKPTFEKPAYILVAKRAEPEGITQVKGTGKDELGVNRAVKKDEVLEVWRGRVATFSAGNYGVTERDGELTAGSGSGPSAQVVWEKVPAEETAVKDARNFLARLLVAPKGVPWRNWRDEQIESWTRAVDWNEADHPRGQPENAGQFAESPGGGTGPKAVGAAKPKWTTSQKKNAEIAAGILRAAGYKAVTENPSGHKTDTRSIAIGSATNGILVNQRSKFWKDPVATQKQYFEVGHLSTPHPLGTLLHEIAHTMYPDVQGYWSADMQKAIAAKVSKYAMTNPKEFVSETFAGIHTGIEYDPDVMRLYHLFTRTTASPESVSPPPAPKLPELGKTKEAKVRYAEIKALAERVKGFRALPSGGSSAIGRWVPMYELQSALNDLWDTRMHESGLLSKADQEINDTLRAEVTRRFTEDHNEREKRADAYAYMNDEEFKEATRLSFGGDSRMKPGMKAQLGRLPVAHIRRLATTMHVRAVQEIEALSDDHPYAPGMHPAGLFEPDIGKIRVADQITLPDGSIRMLASRASTLRHEVGHAIDDITGLSYNPVLLDAIDQGISKMTPEERKVAAYYLAEKYPVASEFAKNRARASEMFAELYAYAYNEGAEDAWSFGGLSQSRRYELFGKARQILRQKLAEEMGDRTLDQMLREAA